MICVSLFLISGIHQNKAYAEDETEICFDQPTAKRIFTDLSLCNRIDHELKILKIEFESERSAFDLATDNLEDQISLLDDQRQDEHNRSEKYRLVWKECGEALTTCQQSKPQRMTWFGAGFGSALVMALIILAL